jgi:hypothetical protein
MEVMALRGPPGWRMRPCAGPVVGSCLASLWAGQATPASLLAFQEGTEDMVGPGLVSWQPEHCPGVPEGSKAGLLGRAQCLPQAWTLGSTAAVAWAWAALHWS